MSEPNDQPAEAGVGGAGNAALNDDIDTSAFDRMEVPEDDDGSTLDPATGGADGGEGDDAGKAGSDDDGEEIEVDGVKAKVPKALKDAFLRHADYTRKTQEIGEQRRALDEERSTWETQREQSRAALPEEHAKVAVLNHNIAEVDKVLDQYRQIDWDAWRSQVANLPADDPGRQKFAEWRDRYANIRDSRVSLEDQLAAAKTDLQTKETARLESAKAEADKALLDAFEETGKVLAAEIKGWNGELAGKVAKYMVDNLGATPAEIRRMTDPRMWKMGHKIMSLEARNGELEKALQQHKKADDNTRAQDTKPAESTKGKGAGSVRDPSTPRGDGLSTDEWAKRRRAQLAARRG